MKLSISEILTKAATEKKKADKVDWLRKNDSPQIRMILRLTYDENIKFLIPDTAPPWTRNEFEDEAKPLLFREARRLKIFVEGGGYDTIHPIKRETLFIQLLQDIDNNDAELLANNMIAHKPIKGLTRKTVEESYPNLFTSPLKI
jgi:hypothetical protein